MSKRPTFFPDERVDLPDFANGISYGRRVVDQALRALLVPKATAQGQVLEGFALVVNGAGNGVRIVWGTDDRMLLSELADGTRYAGHVAEVEDGTASVELLLANFSPAALNSHWDVYLRRVFDPSDAQNRAFWSVSVSSEVLQSVLTQDTPTFELCTVAHGAASPGTEWSEIGQVDNSGGAVGVIIANDVTPMRNFLFEGSEVSVGVRYKPSWGDGAHDRDANRALYGAHDLATFVQLVRRQIQDILGAGPAGVPIGGMRVWTNIYGTLPSLYDLSNEHGHAGTVPEGHHLNTEIWSPTGIGRLTFHNQTAPGPGVGLDAVLLHGGGLAADSHNDLFLGGLSYMGPTVRIAAPGAGLAGGLIIGGPDGILDADMAAGQLSWLRFGNLIPGAGWDQGKDFRWIAGGAAADANRFLVAQVGLVGTLIDALTLRGTGEVAAASVGGYFSAVALTGYRTQAAAVVYRSIDPSAFVPGGKAYQGTVADLTATAVDTPWWDRVHNDLAGNSVYGAGVTNDVLPKDVSTGVASGNPLVASLGWLPNGAIIQAGDAVHLSYETNAGWANPVGECHYAVAIIRKSLGVRTIIAYARFTPADGAHALAQFSANWLGAGGTIDHATGTYFIEVTSDTTAAIAPGNLTGGFAWFELDIPFRYTNFRH